MSNKLVRWSLERRYSCTLLPFMVQGPWAQARNIVNDLAVFKKASQLCFLQIIILRINLYFLSLIRIGSESGGSLLGHCPNTASLRDS